jgi:hypothetical protein
MFFDADDFLARDTLRPMYEVAKQNPDDAVYCGWCKFWREPTQFEPGSTALRGDMPGWLWMLRAFEHDYPTYNGSFVFPHALISRQGGWDPSLSFQDDMEFAARIITNVGTMRFCPEAMFCYRQDAPGSLSKRGGRRSSESHLRGVSKSVEHLLSVRDTPQARAAAARQLMLVSHAQYFAAPDISRAAEDLAKNLSRNAAARTWLKGGPIRRVLQALFGWRVALAIHARLRAFVSKTFLHR